MFNVEQARKSGYTDEEIANHLASTRKFDLAGAIKNGYSHKEVVNHLSSLEQTEKITQPIQESKESWWKGPARATLETVGVLGGGTVGAPLGPLGAVGGAGLGYAAAKKGEELLGLEPAPKTFGEAAQKLGTEIVTGAAMEAGGQIAGAAIPSIINIGKKVLSAGTGLATGQGTRTSLKALEGGEDFISAMRGRTTPDEIMNTARSGLQKLKDIRSQEYLSKFENIKTMKNELDFSSIISKKNQLMKDYGIRRDPDGTLDFTRSTLDKKSWKDIENVIETINDWGTKTGDLTPRGLDTLKRRLDDFYSETKNSRALITSLRNSVKDLLTREIPEYSSMTKDYSTFSKVIEDVDNFLNKGQSDIALKRFMDAIRLDKKFRGDLVETLSETTGKDIEAEIAGALSKPWFRSEIQLRQLAIGFATLIDPKLASAFAITSPRLTGEFLRLIGMGTKIAEKTIPVVSKGTTLTPLAINALTQGD